MLTLRSIYFVGAGLLTTAALVDGSTTGALVVAGLSCIVYVFGQWTTSY